jgi:GLPGLI family protein
LNDLKEVAGHICMKAQVEDLSKIRKLQHGLLKISFQAGPERLWGFPGMILELDINDGAVTVVATKIEFKKVDKELEPLKN